jgi:hypothetical protein
VTDVLKDRRLASLLLGVRTLLDLSPRYFKSTIPFHPRECISDSDWTNPLRATKKRLDSLERPSLSLVHEIACFLIARHQQEAPTPASNISSSIRVYSSRYNSTHLLLPSESNIDRRHACSIFPNCEKTASNSPLSAMLSVWPRNIPTDPFNTH